MKKSNYMLNLFPIINKLEIRKLHMHLNQYYYMIMFGKNKSDGITASRIAEIKKIESWWFEREIQLCLQKYRCDRDVHDIQVVEHALKNHAVFNHVLFDYLCFKSDLNALKNFILNESILNLEFFDYLVLALIGASPQSKAEIVRNLWDEAGQGDISQFHTTLFIQLMNDLNLKYKREDVIEYASWQALSGINLFSYCSIYPYNKMKYFGLLAATEMLDPSHYQKLIQGIRRLCTGLGINYSYYSEHELIDVEHAQGWLRKVILPELRKDPNKTRDFWLGFYLRLDSAKKYYDYMLHYLTQNIAA